MTPRRVVIVGGGHNALVAAAYLAQAGLAVTVLERLDHVGGAAVSERAFEGVDARLSRYSYLVSLLPKRIIRELGLSIELRRRRYSSYTPVAGTDRGLLIDNADPAATEASFRSIGASADEWHAHGERTAALARALFPTVCEPLLTRSDARRMVDAAAWNDFVERPVGEVIERTFESDLVRGVVLTDALIGTLASAHELAANRCYLYHVIGGGTGDWDVPVGGMGAVSGELERAARAAGAEIVTGAEVTSVTPDGEVGYIHGDRGRVIGADVVLAGVAPAVLARLMGERADEPIGSQVKINMLLRRLPRLADASVAPEAAFGGTFHINEGYRQLDDALTAAREGRMPSPLPAEIYCHTLADPSILSPELAASGAHTLTLFGLHTPHGLDVSRDELTTAALASLGSVLGEPIEPLLMTDAAGRPCLETKTTADLADALAMPGGNIFHGPLSWPFAEDDEPLSTPAQRWGVDTGHDRVLLCGAGARRGGGVSGIGGHNAAMAVLELLGP
ncbi:MAG: NAD(P)/FAD-dependent oxidoreductase [Microbacteriaceae bacterium]|nr:NAD(P)/FAD-dependent oxidoreductase [Microbacteriaceae bacterium]